MVQKKSPGDDADRNTLFVKIVMLPDNCNLKAKGGHPRTNGTKSLSHTKKIIRKLYEWKDIKINRSGNMPESCAYVAGDTAESGGVELYEVSQRQK